MNWCPLGEPRALQARGFQHVWLRDGHQGEERWQGLAAGVCVACPRLCTSTQLAQPRPAVLPFLCHYLDAPIFLSPVRCSHNHLACRSCPSPPSAPSTFCPLAPHLQYITRTNTKGGQVPSPTCTMGEMGTMEGIDYSATFKFWMC